MTIIVRIQSGIWRRAGEGAIIRRIAHAVIGSDDNITDQQDGHKWCLDMTGNDWFASELKQTGDPKLQLIEVTYRYGGGRPEVMRAWETVLSHIFGN